MVFYDRTSTKCRIILDSSPGKVASCDPDKIEAIPEIMMDPGKFRLNSATITCFMEMSGSLHGGVEKKKEEVLVLEKKEWSCEVCTLINEADATSCSVCSTRKPASQEVNFSSFFIIIFHAVSLNCVD
jgi:hypothetical protein